MNGKRRTEDAVGGGEPVARLNIPTPAPPQWPRKTLINSRPAARLELLRVALLALPEAASEIKAASANDKEYK